MSPKFRTWGGVQREGTPKFRTWGWRSGPGMEGSPKFRSLGGVGIPEVLDMGLEEADNVSLKF